MTVLPIAMEAWPAIFGGLIPIVGLVGIGYVIVRAARDTGDDKGHDDGNGA